LFVVWIEAGISRTPQNAAFDGKDEHVSGDGALECISASGGIAHPEGRSQGVLKIKARIQEYRYLNVSLVIGSSVTAFQLYVRRSRSVGETSVSAIQPLAETLSDLAVGHREGVSSRTLMRSGTTSATSYRNGAFRKS
jgi:hypothetical protein